MNRFRRGARMVLLFRRFTRRMTPAELEKNVALLHESFLRRQAKKEQQKAKELAALNEKQDSLAPITVKKELSSNWKKSIGKVFAVSAIQDAVPDAILRAQAEKAHDLLKSPSITSDDPSSFGLDGDLSFYEDSALERRASLLEHPDLSAYVSEIWQELKTTEDPEVPGDRVLFEKEYIEFHALVSRALVPGVQEHELEDLARTDWENDTERLGKRIKVQKPSRRRSSISSGKVARRKSMVTVEKVCLTEAGFTRSLLEMADLWTDSIECKEYMDFLAVVSNVVRNESESKEKSPRSKTPPPQPIKSHLSGVLEDNETELKPLPTLESLPVLKRQSSDLKFITPTSQITPWDVDTDTLDTDTLDTDTIDKNNNSIQNELNMEPPVESPIISLPQVSMKKVAGLFPLDNFPNFDNQQVGLPQLPNTPIVNCHSPNNDYHQNNSQAPPWTSDWLDPTENFPLNHHLSTDKMKGIENRLLYDPTKVTLDPTKLQLQNQPSSSSQSRTTTPPTLYHGGGDLIDQLQQQQQQQQAQQQSSRERGRSRSPSSPRHNHHHLYRLRSPADRNLSRVNVNFNHHHHHPSSSSSSSSSSSYSSCLQCPQGKITYKEGETDCKTCPIGKYESNSIVCLSCNDEVTTLKHGSSNISDCNQALPGYYIYPLFYDDYYHKHQDNDDDDDKISNLNNFDNLKYNFEVLECSENTICSGGFALPAPKSHYWSDRQSDDIKNLNSPFLCSRNTCKGSKIYRKYLKLAEQSSLGDNIDVSNDDDDDFDFDKMNYCWTIFSLTNHTLSSQLNCNHQSKLQCLKGSEGPLCGSCIQKISLFYENSYMYKM